MAYSLGKTNAQIQAAVDVAYDLSQLNAGVVEADGEGSVGLVEVDATPTQSSTNLVQSGGVKSAIDSAVQNYGAEIITLSNVSVSSWTSDSTYTGFGYKADITVTRLLQCCSNQRGQSS